MKIYLERIETFKERIAIDDAIRTFSDFLSGMKSLRGGGGNLFILKECCHKTTMYNVTSIEYNGFLCCCSSFCG